MSQNLLSSTWQLLKAIWEVLDRSSPAANFLAFVPVFGLVVGAVRLYVHRKLKTKEWELHLLKRDFEETKFARAEQEAKRKEAEARAATVEARLPDSVLRLAEKERRDRNFERANRVLASWCQQQSTSISEIMFQRSQWALTHAVSDQRALGFVAAEAYALAAVSFWPGNLSAFNLLNDLDRMMEEEVQPWPAYKKTLVEFEEYSFQPFERDLIEHANMLEAEASMQNDKGRYHMALPIVERALQLSPTVAVRCATLKP